MSDELATTLVVAVVMVIGVVGTVVPFLPGIAIVWAAALVYGLIVGFGPVGIAVMIALSLGVIVSIVASVLVPRRMAERHHVAWWSQVAAVAGAVIGFFVIPVVGVVVGALVGLFGAELATRRDAGLAWQGTMAVAKGFGIGVLIDVALATGMITLWGLWALTVVL